MCHPTERPSSPIELADIFLAHAECYREKQGVSAVQNKAILAITRCRTSALGGHVSRCNHCGALEIAYNSCRYRHCPKCQTTKRLLWLQARKAELLPVPYFHVVFTLPHEFNALASYNPTLIYNLLFQAAWATINTLGRDKKRLNGQMGMIAFLHTWGQTLSQHIHLHCMVPAGALQEQQGQQRFNPAKSSYLFPNKVMSKLFGKLFLTSLLDAFNQRKLTLKGSLDTLSDPQQFTQWTRLLAKKSWNVYAKEPFHGAEGGMEYLARYFSKTAIGNERLISFENKQVTFKWRDYSDNNKTKRMTLEAHEFIRRYLSHILPDGFMRVRYFGFLANAVKKNTISLIRSLLSSKQQINSTNESTLELIERVMGINLTQCKQCKIGQLVQIERFKPNTIPVSIPWDTS
jgi:hypothetical protein